TRLHGRNYQPLVGQRQTGDMRSSRDDPLDLRVVFIILHGTGPIDSDIRGRVGPKLRCAFFDRSPDTDNGRKWIVFHFDVVGGVLRDGVGGSDNKCYRLTNMQHTPVGERWPERNDQDRFVASNQRYWPRDVADPS